MAQFRSTTFGAISGKHGTAVASTRNGKSILRVFTPAKSNSPAQQVQRMKFGITTKSLNVLRNLIYIGFGGLYGFYSAVSYALRHAVVGDYPDFSLDYAKVLVSTGTLPQSVNVGIAVVANTGAEITWNTETWSTGSADDMIYIGFLNPATQMPVFVEAQARRNEGRLTVPLPRTWVGATIHAWLFFVSPDGQQSSVSQYLGTIVPA